MTKKMYSFRLNKNLIDDAKRIAKEMDISLSLFISLLVKEKINNLNSQRREESLFKTGGVVTRLLQEIVTELKELRSDLDGFLKE